MSNEKKNEVTILTLDRRDLLKWSAAGAAGMLFMDFEQMLAAGVGDFATGMGPENAGAASGVNFFHWLDGPFGTQFGSGFQDGLDRQKLAVYLDIEHKKDSYVEGVFVTDANRKVMAGQRFVPEQANSKGKAPFAIFDNIKLEQGKKYFIYYAINKGDTSQIFRFDMGSAAVRQSRLDYLHYTDAKKARIPQIILDDMKSVNTMHKIKDRQEGGWITTPYQGVMNRLPAHMVRAKLKDIKADGTFSFDIAQMHGDVNDTHYMRYFLILDPVGRVLGGLRRAKTDDPNHPNGDFHSVTNSLVQMDAPPQAGYAPSDFNITDCPYVQIFTEDKMDAICRITYRLR